MWNLYLFFACHSFNWPIQGVLIKYLGLNGLTLSSQEGNGIQLELYYSTVRIVNISIRLYIFVCNWRWNNITGAQSIFCLYYALDISISISKHLAKSCTIHTNIKAHWSKRSLVRCFFFSDLYLWRFYIIKTHTLMVVMTHVNDKTYLATHPADELSIVVFCHISYVVLFVQCYVLYFWSLLYQWAHAWTLMKAFVFPLAKLQRNPCQPENHFIIICILLLESMKKHSWRPFQDRSLFFSY